MRSLVSSETRSHVTLRLSSALVALCLCSAAHASPQGTPDGVTPAVVPLLLDASHFEGLEEVDPAAGITLVQPPEASNLGDARLSYPLEVPPGRRGMEPHLEVTYSSQAGNGWLGLGWSLSVPAITIDTRWGVPRYGATHETETYLLDGQQLTPLAHRGDPVARAGGDRIFHARVEGAFARIVRHGPGPSGCWWEVTDTAGTVYSYGGRLAAGGFETEAVLTDDPLANGGNVFVWALREIRDTHGNTVVFGYDRAGSTGLPAGVEPGHELYLRSVRYSGHGADAGPYQVTFLRDGAGQAPRPDAVIDALGGFKRVTAELLRRVEVSFDGELVRAYDFAYVTGAFEKTLLRSITQRGPGNEDFHTHTFDYYDEVRTGAAYEGFGAPQTWDTGSDGLGETLFGHVSSGAVSSGTSDDAGGSVYAGFNFAQPQKENSFGVNVGYRWNGMDGLLELVDVTGDNLPDKVFQEGGGVWFRPNTSGPDADPAGVAFGGRLPLPGVRTISEETSHTFFVGPEEHFTPQLLNSNAWTWSRQSAYLADANGDGLVDLVDVALGGVQFNRRTEDGTPAFSPDSSLTPVPVVPGDVDPGGILDDYRSCRDSLRPCSDDGDCPDPVLDGPCVSLADALIDTYPLLDTVRRWVAPWDGRVAIEGSVSLAASPECVNYPAADGVRVAIERNGEELWAATVLPGDEVSPEGVGNLQVGAGDRFYFRVQSREDGACDQVAWDPAISYRNGQPPADANRLDPYRYGASGDFVLAGRRGAKVWMPANGTVRLDGVFRKAGATSDDVAVQVYYGASQLDERGTLLLSQPVAWNETGDLSPALDIEVRQGGWVLLRVQTDSPIDLTQITWTPRLYYVAPDSLGRLVDDQGNYLFQLEPPYDVDAYPFSSLAAPQEPWIAPYTGTVTASTGVLPLLPFPLPCPEGPVAFTVKRPGELLAKGAVDVEGCFPRNVSVTFQVTRGDEVFFDYSVFSPELSERLAPGAYAVTVAYDPDSIDPPPHAPVIYGLSGVLHRSGYPELLFALPYRGWSTFGYNGNRDRAGRPIDEGVLDEYQRRSYARGFRMDPRKEPAHPYMPRPARAIWLGPDELAWTGARVMSSSRLGSDNVHVPGPDDLARGPAVVRQSRTFQSVIGIGVLAAAYSQTFPGGAWTAAEVDYLDMNGDLFPDVVSGGHVQYTTPRGGLEAASSAVPGFEGDDVRETGVFSWSGGLGANPTWSIGDARGRGGAASAQAAQGKAGKAAGKPAKGSASGGQKEALGNLSLDVGKGEFDVTYDLVDVNGDGLPDRVKLVTLQVDADNDGLPDTQFQAALNLGYRFGRFEPWEEAGVQAAIGASSSWEFSPEVGLGYNVDRRFGFAGGVSYSHVSATVEEELADVNGDGLDDRVISDGTTLRAAFNTGSGFAAPVVWAEAEGVTSNAQGLGGGLYFTIPIGPLCIGGCYVIINPGGDYRRSIARQLRDLRDVDGDGCADLVATEGDDRLTVAPNRTGRTNLLRSVARPLGATIVLSYGRDGNTYEMPESRWVLSQVQVDDGQPGDGVDLQTTSFAYAGGRSDRWEREFYGYGTVVATLLEPVDGGLRPYRSVTRTYDTARFASRGLLLGEATADADGRTIVETRHAWLLRDVDTGDELTDARADVATVFPELRRTDRLFYEGQSAPVKSTGVLYEYELQEGAPGVKWSNLVQVLDLADEGPRDDLQLDVGYFTDAAAHIVGKPASLRYSSQGRELRRRELTLEPGTGDVEQVRDYLADGTAATTDSAHDLYGNTTAVTFPPNLGGQRYAVTYGYDDRVFTHLVRVEDSFGLVSTARHDLRLGKPQLETDVNGNSVARGYDRFGRLVSVTGPYETGTGLETVRYAYHHDAPVPWAMARRVDRFDPAGDPIDSVFFVDGLARVIQSKRDASVHQGASAAAAKVMIVSGASKYDFAGRTVEQRHPITEELGRAGDPNPAEDGVEPSRMSYDVLDRLTSLTLADGSVTRYAFGFGRDRGGTERLLTRTTDAREVAKEIFRDVRGLVVAEKESAAAGAPDVWTGYEYDPLRRLVAVVDDRGNAVEAGYDNLGRRVGLSSPDGGLTETRYDLASNAVERVTANLRLSGGSIRQDYDYGRLTAITYPAFPENNVTFSWGAAGAAGNAAGRVVRVADESGVESFSYGPLGGVAQRTKTVASDTQGRSANGPESYVTRFSSDTWGRLRLLTYPDGEVLTHGYDSGGLLREIAGVKGGNRYSYVRRLEYDKFLDRAFVRLGNGVATEYGYDPRNRCLDIVRSGPGPGRGGLFQDLRLSCDPVGNVTRVRNLAAIDSPRWMGGATDYAYSYDGFNRLTGAEGRFEPPRDKAERFTMGVEYDSIHNVVAMTREHQVVHRSGKAVTRRKTSVDLRYLYGGRGAHGPDRIGAEKVEWDAGGNQVLSREPGRDGRRTLVWDEENRLQAISLGGQTVRYKYDAGGARVISRGPQGETADVNRYLTVRNREVALKHVFAGDARVATKLMKQDRPGSNPAGRMPLEKDVYFYHGDQLGSTTFVTDAQGELFEHREYFPFGGLFVDESSNTRRAPYLFAAQELDEVSGLYFFGSRYYDPDAALWLSADPTLAASFPGGGPQWALPAGGGVFETRNLNPYGYAGQNPVVNVGAAAPPFSRTALSGATLLRSPAVDGGPSLFGAPTIAHPDLDLRWLMEPGTGVLASGSWPAAARYGVSQLTQDQALSVEEAPAVGALDFDWPEVDLKKVFKKKPAPRAPAAGARPRARSVAAPGPAVEVDDHDAAPRRRRAASAP